MNSKTPLYFGMLGGGIVIALFIIAIFSINFFNYRIQISKIHINATNIDATLNNKIDSLNSNSIILKKQLIKELNDEKVILTPQEYTSNVIDYYNTAFLILTIMLGAFSFLSFVYLKSHSSDLIQEKLQSEKFKDEVGEVLVGKAEGRFRESLSELSLKLTGLENEVSFMKESLSGSAEEKENDDELV